MPSDNILFKLNVDELVSDLDVDVPLDSVEQRGEEELKFQKDDSQDVPIRISSQVSRDFGNSKASSAGDQDKEEIDMEASPDDRLREGDNNTAIGTLENGTQDTHSLQKDNVSGKAGLVVHLDGRDAMEIAEEL